MSIELRTDDEAARDLGCPDTDSESRPSDRARPNVSGDLPTVLGVGPMFRRTMAGYDRFQVDSYVRWAEDELVAADRQREHLLARHLETQAALAEARTLLAHSSGGGEFLQVSRRIGSMLAAAADEAETIRAEAENHRSVARAQAEVMTAEARRVVADAEAEATRRLEETAAEVARRVADADRIVTEAEQAGRDIRAAAAAHLEAARVVESRAVEQAGRIRQQAAEEALAARVRAREEIVAMLGTGREERRRADAEAAVVRERLDRDAATRRAALLAELSDLEQRRDGLRAELEAAPGPVARTSGPLHLQPRAYLERLQGRLGWHSTTGRAAAAPVTGRSQERTAA